MLGGMNRTVWLVATGTALIAACYGLARFTYGLFAPDFAAEFALSPVVLGVLGAGGYVGYCVAILVATAATPRWGARWVGVLAGATATVGTLTVATASSAAMLAVGVLIAGSSTGIASPPMADAVARWVTEDRADRAQTVVNAGTGAGVLVSGPIALALLAHWRVAWLAFAALCAVVTVAVWRCIPAGRPASGDGRGRPVGVPPGAWRLLACSALLGLGSIAVWTLGRQAVVDQGGTPLLATTVWTVIGAAGIAGATAGPVVNRLGLVRSWRIGALAMAAAGVTMAVAAGVPAAAVLAAAGFGATYIALSGMLLLWATRLFPDRASYGVGLAFLLVAVGQAVGSPLAGAGVETLTLPGVFVACAAVTGASALLVAPTPRTARCDGSVA
jgi:predicted MFS family arabinose efflux permease